MNKAELISAIAEKAEITKKDAEAFLSAFTASVTDTLAKGEDVALVGFGTFAVTSKAARTGKNPKDGSPVQIPACKAPKFKAGKALKDAVNA